MYFAGAFDESSYTEGFTGTIDSLAEAVVWAAGVAPPVKIDVSPTVEVTTYYSEAKKAYTVMLVNGTTNQLHPQVLVRHVEPVHDTRILIYDLPGDVKSVKSVTGEEVKWEANYKSCCLDLPRVWCFEAVIVELM